MRTENYQATTNITLDMTPYNFKYLLQIADYKGWLASGFITCASGGKEARIADKSSIQLCGRCVSLLTIIERARQVRKAGMRLIAHSSLVGLSVL